MSHNQNHVAAGVHAGAPVRQRQRAVRAAFGFRCSCSRCTVEELYDYAVPEVGATAIKGILGFFRGFSLRWVPVPSAMLKSRVRV